PLVEAVLHRLDDREQHEDCVQDQGGQHEQRDREPPRPGPRTRPPACGAAGGRHGPPSITGQEWSVPATPARSSTRPTVLVRRRRLLGGRVGQRLTDFGRGGLTEEQRYRRVVEGLAERALGGLVEV